jgi:hypothetical protein
LNHGFRGGTFVVVSGDRNLGNNGPSGCSRFLNVAQLSLIVTPQSQTSALRWDTNLHNNAGNVLRLDGAVNQYPSDALKRADFELMFSDEGSRGRLHMVIPR